MSTFHAADKMIKRAKTWEISDSEAESDTENHLHRSQTGISTVSPEFKWRLSNCDKETSTTTNNNNNNKNNNNNNAEHYDQSVNETPSNATHEKDALALPQTTTGSISDSPSPTGKRNRRTQEEIEADKIKAEQKKEEREAQKRERERVKEEKRLEQQKRKQAAELLKCYRPDQCLKYMTVCIDPAVLEVAGSEILWESVHMMESRSTIQPQPVPCSITWTREIPQCNTTDVAEMEESSVKEEQIMMLVSQEEFLEMAVSMKQSQLGLPQDDDVSDSKSSLLFDFLQKEPGKTGTLAVLGCEPHSWCFQRGVWRGRGLEVTEADIEEVLVSLQLQRHTGVLFLESWKELSRHVCAVTKAVAKRPFRKQAQAEGLSFCADGSWAGGVRVEKDGAGLRQVWQRQLQQLNRVSPAMAAAIVSVYPSPQLLLQAYEECSCERDQVNLLADITVRAGDGARERRLGPELSRRLQLYMRARNAELVLDSCG
ncbi:probable crossover junction endonuclease EME2 isoform X1 [Acipenser ruthenus]|uniref:probable crossover junction endonuclease EME2 isoform X1 n=2 Tax=Acipenser ruthenus TaxID=7906 RepID=UPI00145A9C9C|nr:probable crossover junction endonuclease EME2 isoform X1 [Acipenser ruthenus]XP_033908427.3 probable crossover junction endonuclease EME2 isoform X1 [Acipenser ruthenus]XP_033908428.3 probable crossover junction endonuclease EME2 isoform X1 [Acipenser ruthenus]